MEPSGERARNLWIRGRPIGLFLAIGLAMIGLRIAWVALCIVDAGRHERARPSDVVIVLGAAVSDGRPSPVFEARLQHAVALWRRSIAPDLLLTGGIGAGDAIAESEAGRSYVVDAGIPPDRVWIETRSHTTRENLAQARALMHTHGWSSAVLVSDPLHLYRAEQIARELGIAAVTSPAPATRYRSLRTKLPFLLREIYFVHHHLLLGR